VELNGEIMKTMTLETESRKYNKRCGANNAQSLFVRNQSCTLFKRAMAQGKLRRMVDFIFRKPSMLVSLASEIQPEDTKTISDCGLQTVPLSKIIGSENRCHDFDIQFAPKSYHLLERWVRISDLILMDEMLPPVKLIRVGSFYFVRDGHHRISVAKALGRVYIDACVTKFQLNEQAFEQFARNLFLINQQSIYLN
jgi:hypothetical protein